jgi:ribonuclease D
MTDYQYIKSQSQLLAAVEHLQNVSRFAIDTEFDSNHYRYGHTLCLIQIATHEACFLIDPFEVKDLSSLWQVFENESIEKIFHDCNEDLRILNLAGCTTKNIFDTSEAAKILGMERTGLSSVLEVVLGKNTNKKNQRSDWTQRPLSAIQLAYAASDVTDLEDLRNHLTQRLQEAQRWHWFEQGMEALSNKKFTTIVADTFLSKDEQRKSSPFDQYVLNELYRYRDQLARQINRPLYQVIANELLPQIIDNPALIDDWCTLKGMHYRAKNESVQQRIASIYRQATQKAQEMGLPKTIKRLSKAEWDAMQANKIAKQEARDTIFEPIRNHITESYGIQMTALICSKKTIDSLLNDLKISQMLPYQQQIIGQAASELQISLSDYW